MQTKDQKMQPRKRNSVDNEDWDALQMPKTLLQYQQLETTTENT